MCDCATAAGAAAGFTFRTAADANLLARFDGGQVTGAGGLPRVARAEAALGVCAARAGCVPEWRRGPVRHSPAALVRRRVFRIACGYEDQDDADTLRSDPLLELACGRLPASEADPASQPTLSRLENAVDRHAVERLAEALAELYIRERGRDGVPARILLDPDGTDDPAHGEQEGVAYHGYYRQHMYHPLPVLDGDGGHLITAILRPGNVHGSRFVVPVLRRLLCKLRAARPGVAVEVRADSGFAIPRLYAWCEANAVGYTIGLIPNPALEAAAALLPAQARARSAEQGGIKVRPAGETAYQAGSWPAPRRVVFKAEVLEKGPNTRSVVTTRTDDPLAVYDRYADAARLQLDTLRLRVIEIGGRVREITDHAIPDSCLHLSSHHPGQPLRQLLARITRTPTWGR